MSEILLTPVIATVSNLERLNLFAGRHLGQAECDCQQAYLHHRTSSLLAGSQAGIVKGLDVRTTGIGAVGDGLMVSPGLAVAASGQSLGLDYPRRQTWKSLIEDYLMQTSAESAAGIFYLALTRSCGYVNADQSIYPGLASEFDAIQAERQLVGGQLGLKRLAISAAAAASNRELVENWVAANHVGLEFLQSWKNSVPLGLLAIEDTGTEVEINHSGAYRVNWFAAALGRYEAISHSGYQVLLNQTREAFRRLRLAAASQTLITVSDYLAANLKLDFLPAAGELPIELIQNIASHSIAPTIAWLPSHIAVDLVPVLEESVAALIDHHLPRRVVDLRQAAGDRLRLLLAFNEADYKPHLLDIPQPNGQLTSDIFRYFARAYDQWVAWKNQFNYLYNLPDSAVLDAATLQALDLPHALEPPQLPQDFFAQVINQSRLEIGMDADDNLPYPYSLQVPSFPLFYQHWGIPGSDPVQPKPVLAVDGNGLVVQYSIARLHLANIDNQIRELQSRIEKTRDYLMLQRQQLDCQSLTLSALIGGAAGADLQLTSGKMSTAPTARAAIDAVRPVFNLAPSEVHVAAVDGATQVRGSAAIVRNAQHLTSSKKAQGNHSLMASTLRQSPTAFSALQFNLNNNCLERIAEMPKKTLTKPAGVVDEFRFRGVEQSRRAVHAYKNIIRGTNQLISALESVFGKTEAVTIRTHLLSCGKAQTYEEVAKEARDAGEEIALRLYEAMFVAGKILTNQIAYMESRCVRIEADIEGKLRARINKENEIEKLIALIRSGTEQLAVIDQQRVEYLGDYGVVQRLLDEDWLRVFKLDQERTRVLTKGAKGLYFIRVCQTPVGLPLADPLLLRYSKSRDTVPGCDADENADLPDEVDDFFETVVEIAINDWAALRPFKIHIPAADKLDYIDSIRRLRLQNKTAKQVAITQQNVSHSLMNISLYSVRIQTQATLHVITKMLMPIAEPSSKIRQELAARVMSLADVLGSTRGLLHKNAQTLHKGLQQAVSSILEKLNDLAPSIRLQWAQLAEDDRLPLERVELWPGLERAEREDFTLTRTLCELVSWWFRQLDSDASAAARTAMRNMVRAVLIHASLGDPAEIIQGLVQVPPLCLRTGEGMRLQLNRTPKVGTLLQLLDTQQRMIALLSVEDHDEKGTLAKIAQVTEKDALVTTQFRVVANRATAHLSAKAQPY